MVPLHKLIKLPRSQRLRKIAKITGEAEQQLMVTGQIPTGETEYLGGILKLLIEDENFSATATDALRTALTNLKNPEAGNKEIHRVLDTVNYLLLSETGRNRADWDFINAGGALDPSKRHSFPGMQVYLEDIRSPFNVGAMFRAAESFGTEKIWLSPLCADPRHKRAERTAMGCVDILPWERFVQDPFNGSVDTVSEKEEPDGHGSLTPPFSEYPIFALETGGTPLEDFSFPLAGIMIAGSEELGVSPRALAAADSSLGRVSIPVYGAKGSLNVSVAFGIVMQAWAACQIKISRSAFQSVKNIIK